MTAGTAGAGETIPLWAADLRVALGRVETKVEQALALQQELRDLKDTAATHADLDKLRAEFIEREQARTRTNRWLVGIAITAAGVLAGTVSATVAIVALASS